jgi:hypothetical protein
VRLPSTRDRPVLPAADRIAGATLAPGRLSADAVVAHGHPRRVAGDRHDIAGYEPAAASPFGLAVDPDLTSVQEASGIGARVGYGGQLEKLPQPDGLVSDVDVTHRLKGIAPSCFSRVVSEGGFVG